MGVTPPIESRAAGVLPLLRHICSDLQLTSVIDDMVKWDRARCRLSPGQRIEALVLNILAGRTPLYRVTEFYEDTATDLVFGDGVGPADLHDDALARALDKLAEAGARRVYSAVALRACLLEGIERKFLHYDTTSISVFGDDYAGPPGGLQITRGHSKDNHPELKQLVLGLLANRQGIPVWADTRDGNSEDTHANRDAIDDFCAALSPEQLRETVYVADGKLVTGDNLRRLSELGLRFLSRLPDSFTAARAAKEAACAADQWDEIGTLVRNRRAHPACYRVNEQSTDIDGHPYRLLVVHSDHLAARKQNTLAKNLDRERTKLHKELAALRRRRFETMEAAGEACDPLLALTERSLFRLHLAIEDRTVRIGDGRRGRPRKDTPTRHATEFFITGRIDEPDPERLAHEQRLLGLFVLVTNLDDRQTFTARRLLEEYRDQSAVEQRFAFIKDPVFIDGIYLKTPRRIEALSYVFVMACLVYSVFERRVRLQLQAQKRQIRLPGKRWSDNPTGKMLLALVDGLIVCRFDDAGWLLCSPPHMTGRAAEVARYAGFDLHAIYATPT